MNKAISQIDWQAIKVISFDLDDTLWDNSGVIEQCLAKLYQFLCLHEPKIQSHFTIDSMERISQQLIQLQKPEYENMTVLRKSVIRQMLQEVGGDLSLINPAFAVFYHWRNQINIPNKSKRLLEQLQKKYNLVATSNGNSNLHKIGLAQYFDKHMIAGIHGRAKPSPEMINKLLAHYQLEPHQLLHIGDSHATDILSAKAANVQSIILDHNNIERLFNV
ncbi:MAG: HAD-IA family hydrolase [Gammaproteobacteria bacterium]|nr:HAD-IA family hydrolase [Gammaproteobacteria bacterium]